MKQTTNQKLTKLTRQGLAFLLALVLMTSAFIPGLTARAAEGEGLTLEEVLENPPTDYETSIEYLNKLDSLVKELEDDCTEADCKALYDAVVEAQALVAEFSEENALNEEQETEFTEKAEEILTYLTEELGYEPEEEGEIDPQSDPEPTPDPVCPGDDTCTIEGCTNHEPKCPGDDSCTIEGCTNHEPKCPGDETCTIEGCTNHEPKTPGDDTDTKSEFTEDTTPVLTARTVTASANGLEFSVTGQLTETTTLNVQMLGSEETDYIRSTVLGLDEQTAGSAYDITLYDNGVEIQPGEDVEVSISGITDADSVYHLPHTSAEKVRELKARALDGAEKTGVRAAASKIAKFVAGDSVPEHEKVDFHQEHGKLKFKAKGFSVYFIASGNMSIGNKEDRGEIENNTNDTYYAMPGTTLYFFVDANSVTWATTLPAGITGRSNGIIYENKPAYQITIPENFVPDQDGTTFTLTANWWGGRENRSGKVTITVLTEQKFIDKILGTDGDQSAPMGGSDYAVYLAVLQNSADYTGIPNEPAQSGAGYDFIEDGYTIGVKNGDGDRFKASNYGSVIDSSIGSHAELSGSVDGSNTVGLVDPSGVKTKAMLKNIDWNEVLKAVFAKREGPWYDTDGNVVDENKINEYEVIPYVIKLETTNDMQGWHIDCCVRKKTSVTLTYDSNIPSGLKLDTNITMPNNVTTTAGTNVTVGAISGMNNGKINVSGINTNENYEFTFQGWNTKPDGTGTSYSPSQVLTLNENTTLYAIWTSNPKIGTGNLKITKNVIVPEGEIIPDTSFTFTLGIKDGDGNNSTGTYKYTVYNATTNVAVADGTGTVSYGGTVSVKHNQYVIINDLPAENDTDGQPNVTITENDSTDYDESWDGGATKSLSTSVKIEGGRRSEVTCTNTAVPKTTFITLDKNVTGNMGDRNKDFTFTVSVDGETFGTYTLNHNTDTVTIENIPVGSTVTITESANAGYTVSATVDGVAATVTDSTITIQNVAADGHAVVFTNDKSANIDTGISLDSIPYILILVGVVAAGGFLFLRKRRAED